MRNILRFLGIVIISAVILFSIGSFYDLPLMKNIQLICWSFILDLFVCLQTKTNDRSAHMVSSC